MKFGVLALDYDGTIARDGVLSPDVKAAIAEARAHGIVVIIVTGRILSDLRDAAGDLNFVDAVVAENGAVLIFSNGQTRQVAHPPPQIFFNELQRRGIAFRSGQCVVEADASAAPAILAIIRELELPLIILFNRSRLMVLPQAISKGTGLREALTILRLSPHNAIAIGDAENDHDLLAACELAAAVSWGSVRLQAEADEVVNGDGPSAVAAYIRRAITQTRLPAGRLGRHRITVGTELDGRPLRFDIRGRNILIVGETQSGKSWVTGLVCEQMIVQGYALCVIDPEGDYGGLELLPGVVVLQATKQPPEITDVARALQHFDLSVVLNLSCIHLEEKTEYLKALLPMLASLRRRTGLPHRIVVDEAHYFLHQPNVRELLDMELGAYTIVTYHPSDLHIDLLQAIDIIAAKRLTNIHEVQTVLRMVKNRNVDPGAAAILGELPIDQAVAVTREPEGQVWRFNLLPRLTAHVRHRAKYFDFNVVQGQEFVFTENGRPIGSPAHSLKEFAALLQGYPGSSVCEHARRGDFSRWIANVFYDHHLASDIRKIEQRHRLGYLRDVRQPIAALILARYAASANL
ncbi:MAG TPA: HAD hydrolase family protein [Terriglobales bacterium]|nr:HAD hydrolase family protein [Terriglobales bacterium]